MPWRPFLCPWRGNLPVTFRSAPRAPHFSLSSVFQPPDLFHPIRSFITSTGQKLFSVHLKMWEKIHEQPPNMPQPSQTDLRIFLLKKGCLLLVASQARKLWPSAVTFEYKTLGWKHFVNALPNVSYSFENLIIWFLARPYWYVHFLFGLWRLLDFEKAQCRLESASDTWPEA